MNRDRVKEDAVRSLDVVRTILPWREKLATHFGTDHGNASLQLIDVLIVMLAGFFNPLVRSQRLLEALSEQQWMRDKTGVERMPKSTLSDAFKRFDPQVLLPMIRELAARVSALGSRDADLERVTQQVLAADGTYFSLAGEVAWALRKSRRNGHSDRAHAQVRWNLQFYVAIIATLLLHLSTGRRVNKYALFWLSAVASGTATWEDMQAGLARVEREKALEKARRARKRLANVSPTL